MVDPSQPDGRDSRDVRGVQSATAAAIAPRLVSVWVIWGSTYLGLAVLVQTSRLFTNGIRFLIAAGILGLGLIVFRGVRTLSSLLVNSVALPRWVLRFLALASVRCLWRNASFPRESRRFWFPSCRCGSSFSDSVQAIALSLDVGGCRRRHDGFGGDAVAGWHRPRRRR